MEIIFLGINDVGMDIYEWLCERESITVQCLLTTENQLEHIREHSPDLIIASGFQHIVPPDILNIPKKGCINLHPGYLPHTRGFNPNVWSIIESQPAGATLHYMDDEIDTGDIIARTKVEKSFADDGKSLYRRIECAAVELFKNTWPDIERGEVETVSQCEADSTYHVKQDFVDVCEINPKNTVRTKDFIDRLRALTFHPFENAYMEIDGTRYYIEVDITKETEKESHSESGYTSEYESD